MSETHHFVTISFKHNATWEYARYVNPELVLDYDEHGKVMSATATGQIAAEIRGRVKAFAGRHGVDIEEALEGDYIV